MIFSIKNLQKFWQYYSVWKTFTKILAVLLCMKIYQNSGNDIQYEKNLPKSWQYNSVCKFTKILAMILCMKNLQKSWQWPLVWKIYENPGNDIQSENNLRKSWQWYLIWGVLPAGVFRRLGVLLCTSPRLGYVVLFWDMEFSRAEQLYFFRNRAPEMKN